MKKSTVIWLWGGGTGIVSVIFYQLLYATGSENSPVKWISLLILFLGIFVGTMQYRKANEGYLTYGQGFKAGFFMISIYVVISLIATAINLQLHPDYVDKMLEQTRNNMINSGASEDQIDMTIAITRKWLTPTMMIISGLLGGLIFGCIVSLITAGLCTKKKPIFEENFPTTNTDTGSDS
jgi:uncharacterized membrane protein YkvI